MSEAVIVFYTCDSAPPAYGRKVENVTRPGAISQRFRVVGAGADPATVTGTIYCANWATAVALCATISAEKGNIVTIQDLSRSLSYRAMLSEVTVSPKNIRLHSLDPSIDGALAMVTAAMSIERI